MTEHSPDARASTSSDPSRPDQGADPRIRRVRALALNEDWSATLIGLLILALALAGLWPGWLVP